MEGASPAPNATKFQRVAAENGKEDDFIPVEVDSKFGRLSGTLFRVVRNGVRRENYSIKFTLRGKQVLQGTGTGRISGAMEVAKKKMRAALEGRWDALDASKLHQSRPMATLGEIIEAYEKRMKEFNPTMGGRTASGYVGALKSLVRQVHGESFERLRADILTEDLVERYFAGHVAKAGTDHLERDRKIRGANSTLRNARSLFTPMAMKCYRGLILPDLNGFLKSRTLTSPDTLKRDLPDEVVWEIAQAATCLKNQCPGLYIAHLLFRHLGMRNDEIENARVEWIERRPAGVMLPEGEGRVIAGFMAIVKRTYWKPKRSEGHVPIAPDVMAELLELTKGRKPDDYLVPARTVSERADLADRDHSNFVRPWLEAYPKKSYELRRWSATKVELRQGAEFRDRFLRHKDRSVGGMHYSTRQSPPAPITLLDCGL